MLHAMFIGWFCFGKLFSMVVVWFCFISRAFLTDEAQKIAHVHVHVWFWPCRYEHLQQQKKTKKTGLPLLVAISPVAVGLMD